MMQFTKMHGNGNDFVLVDNTDGAIALTQELIARLTQRRFGVGCDQLLVAEPATQPAAAIAMRIFNTDGSVATQCGNGLRCFAVYARGRGLVTGERFQIDTQGGLVSAELLAEGRVRTNMGVPRFDPERIPLDAPPAERYEFTLPGGPVRFAALSLGNPHAVIDVDDVEQAPVSTLGPAVQALPAFTAGVNVGFAQTVSETRLRLRVFERGVGETLACGTGACAAVAAGIRAGCLARDVTVQLPGGELEVSWSSDDAPVMMTGPTTHVFNGEIDS